MIMIIMLTMRMVIITVIIRRAFGPRRVRSRVELFLNLISLILSSPGGPGERNRCAGAGPEPARSRARNPQPPPEGLGSVSSFQTLLGPLWGACGVPLGRCLAYLWMIWAAFSYLACVRFLMHFRDVFCEGCSIILFVCSFPRKRRT